MLLQELSEFKRCSACLMSCEQHCHSAGTHDFLIHLRFWPVQVCDSFSPCSRDVVAELQGQVKHRTASRTGHDKVALSSKSTLRLHSGTATQPGVHVPVSSVLTV